jgi:alkylhydroperoxidase/carboxymuconolactone decarboxylase family protein YurZ
MTTPDKQSVSTRVKSEYESTVGRWPAYLDPVLDEDPRLAEAFRQFAAAGSTGHLSQLDVELICVAVNASTTLLHEEALRAHIRNALALGATREQLLEVFELASVIGIHTVTMGMPILLDEVTEGGRRDAQPLTERQEAVKAAYIAARGAWGPFFEDWVRLDPGLMEAYITYSTVPWQRGPLAPKFKEFIYIAVDAQATHLYAAGTRLHVQNALKLGASREEIIEVLAVTARIGIYSCALGLPILREELDLLGASAD